MHKVYSLILWDINVLINESWLYINRVTELQDETDRTAEEVSGDEELIGEKSE